MDLLICTPNKKDNFLIHSCIGLSQIEDEINIRLKLHSSDYYLLQNGKKLTTTTALLCDSLAIHVQLRLNGGKGGFGSMLRAIGAQIEKTTNREACRDLSGRRLRDINEEKRLKNYLESQNEAKETAEDKVMKKIKKLQSKPKHEFKDEKYEQARSELTENVADSVEKGFEMANQKNEIDLKRKANETKGKNKNKKKAKKNLWIGDDLSSSSETESDSESEITAEKSEGLDGIGVASTSTEICEKTKE